MESIVNFLFEVGMLKRTPRSGWQFLGSGGESVAEHSFRTAMIAFVLARLDGTVDTDRVLRMALVHDLPEARTGDLNYMNQKYVVADERRAAEEMARSVPIGAELLELLQEFWAQETAEAIIARDADSLEMLLALKEQLDTGNAQAEDWFNPALARLKTEAAKTLAQQALAGNCADWWFDRSSQWWVHGGKT